MAGGAAGGAAQAGAMPGDTAPGLQLCQGHPMCCQNAGTAGTAVLELGSPMGCLLQSTVAVQGSPGMVGIPW